MGDQEYEWDEFKRISNIAKHGLDFFDAPSILAGPHLAEAARTIEGELRGAAVGFLNATLVTVVFTHRPGAIRIISFRRARNGEKRRYQTLHGR